MKYDFDKIIDRRHSDSFKWNGMKLVFKRTDLLPLWVADMDFETPDFVMEALSERLKHPVLGYTLDPKDYWPAVADWIESHHEWKVKREWLTYIPGIVKGIGMVVNVFTKPDEKVIIQPPVYHPFRLTPEGNHREVVFNPLKKRSDGLYDMDFDNLAEVCDDKCRLLILCNPHNPGGVVWSKETLQCLAHFCVEHHLIVISDEIHCDMPLFGHKHYIFPSVSDEAAQCSITFGAPTKTFNVAGVVSSYAIVPNEGIRKTFYDWLEANEQNEANLFAPIVTVAAFRKGEPWRKEMIHYVEENVEYVIDYCKKYIPQIHAIRPEASFLVWLDCSGLKLNHDELLHLFMDEAKLALNDGEMFGIGGEGHMRLNVGCPRSILKQALEQLKAAMNQNK